MKTRAVIILILILSIVLAYFVILSKNTQKKLSIAESKIESDSLQFYAERLKDSSEDVRQAQIIATQKEALKLGLIEKEKGIKKYNALVKFTQHLQATNTVSVFDSPVVIIKYDTLHHKPDTSTFLRVPQRFTYSDNWLRYNGVITPGGVEMGSLSTDISGELLIAYEKTGLFKSEPIVRLKTDNPYMSTTAFSNVIIEQNTPFWNKGWFRAIECGGSFLVGYYFGSK